MGATVCSSHARKELDRNVKDVTPAKISELTDEEIYGKNVMTAGWGSTDHEYAPRFLQKSPMLVISKEECKHNYKKTKMPSFMHINHLCTVTWPPVCFGAGDSGGPLLYNNEVIGVNAHVCAEDIRHPNEQNGHQSIHYYRDFIKSFTQRTLAYHGDDRIGPSHKHHSRNPFLWHSSKPSQQNWIQIKLSNGSAKN